MIASKLKEELPLLQEVVMRNFFEACSVFGLEPLSDVTAPSKEIRSLTASLKEIRSLTLINDIFTHSSNKPGRFPLFPDFLDEKFEGW